MHDFKVDEVSKQVSQAVCFYDNFIIRTFAPSGALQINQ